MEMFLKLSHYTDIINSSKIDAEGLAISIHVPDKKVMWLGDGAYFYLTGCKSGKKEAKSLVTKKKGFSGKEVSEFQYILEIDDNLIIDLNSSSDISKVISVVENFYKELKEKIGDNALFFLNTFEEFKLALNNINEFLPFSNSNYGNTLGTLINLIYKREEFHFEMVECRFNSVPNKYYLGRFKQFRTILDEGHTLEKYATYQCCVKSEGLIKKMRRINLISHNI